MLFKSEFKVREPSEEGLKRMLAVFGEWQPPDGMEIQGFYNYADGTGGFTVLEADSPATILRALSVFAPWLDVVIVPILQVEEATSILIESAALRDGVS